MVRPKPDPAASHGRSSWRPLGPLFPIQKGGQQLVCPLLGLASLTGERLTQKGYQSLERGARRSFVGFVPSAADAVCPTTPLVLASDASATGLGVCRTSSLEPKGLLALAALQEGHNFRGEETGLIEVGTTPGGVRQAFARLKIKPGAYAIVGAKNESKRIILQTWPDVIVCDACTGVTDTEVKDLINRHQEVVSGLSQEQKANRPAFGQQQASSRKSLRPSTEPCQNTALRPCSKPETASATQRECL